MFIIVKFQEDSNSDSITLYIPNVINDYIWSKTKNRSEWIREAGEDFLKLITGKIMNHVFPVGGRKIISISKPNEKDLRTIFRLVKNDSLFFSRSEFFRMSIFFKMIMEILQKEEEIEEALDYPDEPNTVRVPIRVEANGDKVFKIYKILKKLDF